MDAKQKQKLKKFIKELSSIKGRHTELVSVYIPAGYDLIKIIQHLQQEQGTASNIKDKTTRTHVIDSLEKMIRHLRLYKKTPEYGLAVFSGNASNVDSKVDIKVWSIETPEPITTRMYRCDQNFVLDLLEDMMEVKEVYGLIVLDRREANIGLLKGTYMKELASFTSDVPGKTTKGGQCISYKSLVELNDGSRKEIRSIKKGDLIKSYNFAKREFEYSSCMNIWKTVHRKFLKIVTNKSEIICSKDHLFFIFKEIELNGLIQKQILQRYASDLKVNNTLIGKNLEELKINAILEFEKKKELIDISVENQNFIANGILVHNSQQRYARIREIAAKEFFSKVADAANKLFLEMKDLKGIIIGGPIPTKEAFFDGDFLNNEVKKKVIGMRDLAYTGEFGLNELIDKSKDLLKEQAVIKEKKLLDKFFTLLAKEPNKVTYGKEKSKKALEIGAVDLLLLSESLDDEEMEYLGKIAEKYNTEVEVISVETEQGIQLKELGEVAAILRFPVS